MKHIKIFEDWISTELHGHGIDGISGINENLGSDRMEIAVKKMDSFFSKHGLSKKPIIGNIDAVSPYYQIVTDKKRYKEQLTDTLRKYTEYMQDPSISPQSKKVYADQIPGIKKQLSEWRDNDYETIVINTNFNSKELSLGLISLINSMGYHIVSIGTWGTHLQNYPNLYDPERTLIHSDKIRLLVIQPNYGDLVEFRGEYLYHTTDPKHLDKILKYGLVPKTKNTRFFFPGRIYLSSSKEVSDVIKTNLISSRVERELVNSNDAAERMKLYNQKEKEWVDLRIKNFKGLTLYRDMMSPADTLGSENIGPHEGGFFTYNNIPPEYIEVISKKPD